MSDTPSSVETPNADSRRRPPLYKELPILVGVALVVALLIKAFLLQAFYIPSGSMSPTLVEGDRVLVEKVTYLFSEPEPGDVVVFTRDVGESGDEGSFLSDIADEFRGLFGFPTGDETNFIKRVVGVEGDVVEGRGGSIYVDEERVDEPYLEDVVTADFAPVEVPEGSIFVMGDNRNHSDDSRSYGPIDDEAVVGQAVLLIWPPQDFSTL